VRLLLARVAEPRDPRPVHPQRRLTGWSQDWICALPDDSLWAGVYVKYDTAFRLPAPKSYCAAYLTEQPYGGDTGTLTGLPEDNSASACLTYCVALGMSAVSALWIESMPPL